MKLLTESQVRDRVRALAAKHGGQIPLARFLKVSVPYVNMVLRGQCSPGPPFLAAIKMKKAIRYEPY